MDKKLSPIGMVAREMARHSTLDEGQVRLALEGALGHLMERAEAEIQDDPDSQESVELARQYQAVSEAMLFLGTQLIAFDDIEAEDDVDDEWSPKN